MKVALAKRWEQFVEEAVNAGRFASASDVVAEGLRLVEERDAKLSTLRETIQASIARDEWLTPDELDSELEKDFARLEREGL